MRSRQECALKNTYYYIHIVKIAIVISYYTHDVHFDLLLWCHRGAINMGFDKSKKIKGYILSAVLGTYYMYIGLPQHCFSEKIAQEK